MKVWFVLCVCLVLMLTASVHAADAVEADAIVGEWFIDGEKSVIEMYKCGDKYCGKIVWLIEPNHPDGTVKMDSENPDESKRDRALVGIDIVWDFESNGKNRWGSGTIYDPENGKTYSCKAKLKGDTLSVRGFIGVSIFGRTSVWTRKQ